MAIRAHTTSGRVFVRIEGRATADEVAALGRELWAMRLARRATGLVLVVSDRTEVPDRHTRALLLRVLERARAEYGRIDCVVEGARLTDGVRRLVARALLRLGGVQGGLTGSVGALLATNPSAPSADVIHLWRELRAAGVVAPLHR